MGEQNTGDTDQATPAIPLYADDPDRQKEIAEIRRHTQLERLWLGVAVIAQLAGTLLISRYVPEPLNFCFVVLWGISSWGYIASGFNTLKRSVKQDSHSWQDAIDTITIDVKKYVLDPLDQLRVMLDNTPSISAPAELYEIREAIYTIQEHAPERRGPGRRPLTEQEIAHELERADRAAAEIEAQGRTPTQQEIARRLGIAPKTLQRYRGRMDNKGQK